MENDYVQHNEYAKLKRKYKFKKCNNEQLQQSSDDVDNLTNFNEYELNCSYAYLIHKLGSPKFNNWDFCHNDGELNIKWCLNVKVFGVVYNCYVKNLTNDFAYYSVPNAIVKWKLIIAKYWDSFIDGESVAKYLNYDNLYIYKNKKN